MPKDFALMIGLGKKPPEGDDESESPDRKLAAADELMAAIKDDDAEGVAEALSAIFEACRLEE